MTTLRSPKLIREEINEINPDVDEKVQFIDMFRNADDHSSLIKSTLNQLNKNEILIIESINEVNFSDDAAYRKIIRKISKTIRVKNTEGLAMLHLQKSRLSDLNDVERQLLNIADIVFSIETDKVGGDLENDLKIYKMRGINKMPAQIYKLKFGNSIRIDTARDI